jgi:uncharacterized protein (TIGR02466 family)
VHIHSGSDFSVVYYPLVPKDSGNITFISPNDLISFWWSNFLKTNKRNDKEYTNCFTADYTELTPNTGDLIIFPSWLKHGVSTNNSSKDRISISFNIKFEEMRFDQI